MSDDQTKDDLQALLAEHAYTYPDSFCSCTAWVGTAPERDHPAHLAEILDARTNECIDELRCQVAALEIKLHAARAALAACREAAQKRAGR